MDLKDNTIILLDNNKKVKIKCHKFLSKALNRETCVHENYDAKGNTSITDVKTGYRITGIRKKVSDITEKEVEDALISFIKHYTMELVTEEFRKLEERCPLK